MKLRLFLGKSAKTAATRAALFDSNMHKIVCRLGPRLDPTGGAYSAPQTPSCIKGGLLLKGGERRGGEGRDGERRGGWEEEERGEAKGADGEGRGGKGGSLSFAQEKRKVGAYGAGPAYV